MLDLVTLLALFDPAGIMARFLEADAMTVYMLVFVFMVVESSFVPFPSEVIVPPAAYLACTSHEVNIVMVTLLATAGAIVGALINYYLALWIGRPIVYKFAGSRVGHAFLLDEAKVNHAEEYFDAHGAVSTFIGRLVPAVRQAYLDPRRTGEDECGQVCPVHRSGRTHLERRTCNSGLLARQDGVARTALCQGGGV